MDKKLRSYGLNIWVISVVFILLALAGFLYILWGDDYVPTAPTEVRTDLAATGQEILINYSVAPKCFSDGTGFFFSTNDGIKRYDNQANLKWDFPLSYTNPVMFGEGSFIIAGEHRGKSIHVFSAEGIAHTQNYSNDVLSFSINNKGYSCVVVSEGAGYKTYLYDTKGNSLNLEYLVSQDANNYPLSSDISSDGRILAISYLDTSMIDVASYICFYYINSSESKSFTDSLFATTAKLEGQLISKLSFVDNTLFYIADSQIGAYETGTGNHLTLAWSKDINNEISDFGIINEHTLAVALGKSVLGKQSEPEGTVFILGIDGHEIARLEEKSTVTYLCAERSTLIIGSGNQGRKFTALNDKGKLLWEYTASTDTLDIITLDKPDKVAFIGSQSLQIMERKKITMEVEPPTSSDEPESSALTNDPLDTETPPGDPAALPPTPAASEPVPEAEPVPNSQSSPAPAAP